MIYEVAIHAGLNSLTAAAKRPKWVAGRVARAVRESQIPDHGRVTDVFIGHTHNSFSNIVVDGIRVSNTGSAVKGSTFNMLPVEIADAS